jgi:hypothetical protein
MMRVRFNARTVAERRSPGMKTKLVFVSGVAVGFVLGAGAGRDSYEKFKVKVRGFWQGPTVKDKVFTAAEAIRKAPEVQEQASQTVRKAKEEITGTLRHDTTPHHDEATSGRSPHEQAKADASESAFYGIGGPASGESADAETAHQPHHQDTGTLDPTD